MTSRELWTLEHGDTGVALLPAPEKVNGLSACGAWGGCIAPAGHNMGKADLPENHYFGRAIPHSDRDKSEQPTAKPTTTTPAWLPDQRIKKLVSLSRWERAGMLAYIAATHPEVFDETFAALGLAEP